MTGQGEAPVRRAIRACRRAGLPVVEPDACTCGLHGQLVVLAQPDGLRVLWPYDQRCPIHVPRPRERNHPAKRDRPGRSRSQAAREAWTQRKASTS